MTTSILHPSHELMSLIVAHPDLPIVYIYDAEYRDEGVAGVAEHARYSVAAITIYKDEVFTDEDSLEETIENELFNEDYSEDSNDLYTEADRRATELWAEAQPCILVEVW